MDKKTNADAAKAFGFDLSKTDGLVYYENTDIMDVSELLVVKVKDPEDAEEKPVQKLRAGTVRAAREQHSRSERQHGVLLHREERGRAVRRVQKGFIRLRKADEND